MIDQKVGAALRAAMGHFNRGPEIAAEDSGFPLSGYTARCSQLALRHLFDFPLPNGR